MDSYSTLTTLGHLALKKQKTAFDDHQQQIQCHSEHGILV